MCELYSQIEVVVSWSVDVCVVVCIDIIGCLFVNMEAPIICIYVFILECIYKDIYIYI